MGCRTESKTIGEHEYSVTQWPADKSLLMKFRLGKVFGPSLTLLASAIKAEEEADNQESMMEALSNSISKLFEKTSPEDILALIKETVVGTAVDGSRMTDSKFTELYSGDDLMEVYQVFLFVLKVNYGNLFKGQLADRLLAKVKDNL